jgi:hypothetical protein
MDASRGDAAASRDASLDAASSDAAVGGKHDAGSGDARSDDAAAADAARGHDSGPFDAAPDAADGAHPDAGPLPNSIVQENTRAGTSSWQLDNPALAHEIEGYASHTSVNRGDSIDLFVHTTSPAYTIEVFRLGWYGGAGARSMLSAQTRTGVAQIMPAPAADGLIECAWTEPLTLAIPTDWTSGVYLAKLSTSDTHEQSYITFVVRDDASTSDYLFQSSVTTFQAYNNWGGKSLYDFNSDGEVRASRVSFHRPYAPGLNPEAAGGVGAGEVLTNFQGKAQSPAAGWEYSMVRFVEREGYDVSYVTNIDLHRDAGLLRAHQVLLSVGHDEYWSWEMRRNVEDARDRRGLSVAFISGNAVYWQIRLEPESGAAAHSRIVCYKDLSDPLYATADEYRTTTRFSPPPLARPETSLTGLTLQDYGIYADVVVEDPEHWVFAGTGLAKDDHLSGLLGYEVDGMPARAAGRLRIARSPWTSFQGQGSADMISFSLPSGAQTFAAGSIQFSWGLDDFRSAGVVGAAAASGAAQQMARNILDRFAAPHPPGDDGPRVLREAFEAARDPGRWQVGSMNEGSAAYDPAVSASAVSGRLQIQPLANTSGLRHAGWLSKTAYDLNDAAVSVEVVKATNASSAANTSFAVGFDSENFYRFTIESGRLVMQRRNQSSSAGLNIAYDPAQHRFWRLRHDWPSASMLWQTSADGSSWTTRRSEAVSVPLDALYVELEAGTYQSETDPGIALFDELSIELTGLRDSFDRARDPEHFTPGVPHLDPGAYDEALIVFTHAGQLHIRPGVSLSGPHFGGYFTTRRWNVEGAAVSVEALQVGGAEAEAVFALSQGNGEYARVAVRGGQLHCELAHAGALTDVASAYDGVADRHWQIAHDASAQELVWKTSPDGASWTERRRAATAITWQSARAELAGGTRAPEATPGEIVFDDFRLGR